MQSNRRAQLDFVVCVCVCVFRFRRQATGELTTGSSSLVFV